MKNTFVVFLIAILLGACSGEIPTSEVKQWKDYTVHIESRPPTVVKGMNELLLLANYKVRGRAHNLIVYFRMGPEGKWVQAMQDGHTGVYRRAMKVKDPETDVLYVHLKEKDPEIKDERETLFTFPMNYSLNIAQ